MDHALKINLLGGTHLTLSVANKLKSMGYGPAGICYLPNQFRISYSPKEIPNMKFADLKSWCAKNKIPGICYRSPQSLLSLAKRTQANFALVCGWYHYLPVIVRQRFKFGCAGIHASLLPKFRGGAPLNWALLCNATQTGVSLYEITDQLDAGGIYGQSRFPIGPQATILDLINRSEQATLNLIEKYIPKISTGRLKPRAQKDIPTYALQRTPDDAEISWRRSAREIDCLIRASGRPYAGAYSYLNGKKIIIWASRLCLNHSRVFGAPGQIFISPEGGHLCVVAQDNILELVEATFEDGGDAVPYLRTHAQKRFDGPCSEKVKSVLQEHGN